MYYNCFTQLFISEVLVVRVLH